MDVAKIIVDLRGLTYPYDSGMMSFWKRHWQELRLTGTLPIGGGGFLPAIIPMKCPISS